MENDLDESPKAIKRKIGEQDNAGIKTAPPKKVILIRHSSIEMTQSFLENQPKVVDEKSEVKAEKKVIKLSSLTAKEVTIHIFH